MTIALLITWLKQCLSFILKHWRTVIIVIAVLIVVVATYKACGRKTHKFDEAEIEKARQVIANNDRVELEKQLVEFEVKEKNISDNLVNAKIETINAIDDAKKKAATMTNEEIAREIEKKITQ